MGVNLTIMREGAPSRNGAVAVPAQGLGLLHTGKRRWRFPSEFPARRERQIADAQGNWPLPPRRCGSRAVGDGLAPCRAEFVEASGAGRDKPVPNKESSVRSWRCVSCSMQGARYPIAARNRATAAAASGASVMARTTATLPTPVAITDGTRSVEMPPIAVSR